MDNMKYVKSLITVVFTVIALNANAQWEVTATGSGNNFIVNYPATFSYTPGITFTFKANHTITGAATVNVNALGAIPLRKHGNQNLVSGDIVAGQFVTVVYDQATNSFQITSGLGNAPASGWSLTGNSGTSPATNYIGTNDNQPIIFKTNGAANERMRIDAAGNVGVGISNPLWKLDVAGNINIAHDSTYRIGGLTVLSTRGTINLFLGEYAGFNNTGDGNTFTGYGSGSSNTSGYFNSFYGLYSGVGNTTGRQNSFFGKSAGGENTSGYDNAFFGLNAGGQNTTGFHNTSVGSFSGWGNNTGINNTFIGFLARPSSDNLTNATAIGANSEVSTSNSLVLGNNANVGIGISAPLQKLHLQGGNFQLDGAFMPGGNPGNSGEILYSNGPNNAPFWAPISSIVMAENGLNASGGVVRLGGSLLHNTNILQNGYQLNFEGGRTNIQRNSTDLMPNLSVRNILDGDPGIPIAETQGTVSMATGTLRTIALSGIAGGSGGEKTGVFTRATGSGSSNTAIKAVSSGALINYGAYFEAVQGSGQAYGLYSSAPGFNSYAGFFDGNLNLTNGAFMLNGSAGTSGFILQSNGIGVSPSWVDPNSLGGGQWITSGNNIYNSNSGNVGIGTTSPSAKLDITHSGTTPAVFITNSSTQQALGVVAYNGSVISATIPVNDNPGTVIHATTEGEGYAGYFHSGPSNVNGALVAYNFGTGPAFAANNANSSISAASAVFTGGTVSIYSKTTGANERALDVWNSGGFPLLQIRNNGNIGFGTNDPGLVAGSAKYLSLVGITSGGPSSNTATSFEIQGGSQDANGVATKIDFISRSTSWANFNTARIEIRNTSSTAQGEMLFYTNGGSLTEKMRIAAGGNVGIGTNNPLDRLHVVGNLYYTGALSLSGNTGLPGWVLTSNGAGPSQWTDPATFLPSGATAWTRVSPNIYLTDISDRVGIGTVTPGAKLTVVREGSSAAIPSNISNAVFRVGIAENEGIDFGKMSAAPYLGWMQSGYDGTAVDPLVINPLGGNVGINTGADIQPITGLDVRGTQPKTTTAQNEYIFQVATRDGITEPLALRMGVKPDATFANRYGAIEVDDQGIKRSLILQPSGGNVGIGIVAPLARLHVAGGAVLVSGNTGTTPVSGAGTRMMWVPAKHAFVAGQVSGTHWDDANIGAGSAAFGFNNFVNGTYTFSAGSNNMASGTNSLAVGYYVTASGAYSTALGSYASTSGQTGAIVIADYSTATNLTATAPNQLSIRAAGGTRIFSNAATSIGVTLPGGGNSWQTISDSTKKENFKIIDGEYVLGEISKMRAGSWNYKGQDPKEYRHYGPMAQEFFAAFGHDGIGVIGNDTTITTADFDGVSFIAIQALEKRTADLKELQQQLEKKIAELSETKTENETLKTELNSQKTILSEIEAKLAKAEKDNSSLKSDIEAIKAALGIGVEADKGDKK
jgi:hypothetical protein